MKYQEYRLKKYYEKICILRCPIKIFQCFSQKWFCRIGGGGGGWGGGYLCIGDFVSLNMIRGVDSIDFLIFILLTRG